jgi:hypothetical protein
MNVYLAGSWLRKDEIASYRDIIQTSDNRITITSQWLDGADGPHSAYGVQGRAYFEREALRDTSDVDRCDVLVLFANDPITPTVGGGRHWEWGYAYAKQKTCIVVGHQEHIFYYMPGVFHVDSFDSLLTVLSHMATAMSMEESPQMLYTYHITRPDEPVSCSG